MFYLTKNSETDTGSARSEDSRIICNCKCATKQWAEKNCRDNGAFSMYLHNQPLCLHDCQSSQMTVEQREPSASVVCIHLNLEPKAKRCSRQKSYTSRHGQPLAVTPKLSWKSESPRRRRKQKSGHSSDMPSPSRPRSSASSSSRLSDDVLQRVEPGNSKIQSSATESTSASSRYASPRAGILQGKQQYKRTGARTKPRAIRSKSRSPSGSSKTESSGVKHSEEKEKYGRPKRRKKAKFERPASSLKKTRRKHVTESSSQERQRSKSLRKYKRSPRSRLMSPNRKTSRSSGSTESSRSSVSWEHNLPEPKVRNSFRKSPGHLIPNQISEKEDTETESSSGGREHKSSANYLQDNLQEPQLCCVDYDCAKEICRKCQRMKQRSDCMSDLCTGLQKCGPACLVCSRCYIIPCSSTERLRQVMTSGLKKLESSKHKIKPRKRNRHSSKRSYKHRSSNIPASGEWTQNNTVVSNGSSHTRLQCSGSGKNIAPNRSSQYYQCDLLLGQYSTPTSASVTAPLYKNNCYDQARNIDNPKSSIK